MRYLFVFCTILISTLIAKSAFALTLGIDDVAEAVKAEFVEKGLGDSVDLEFFGGKTSFDIGNAKDFKILLDKLETSEGSDKFSVEAEIFADGESVAQTKLSGRYFVLQEIAVPLRDVSKDEIIKQEDVSYLMVRAGKIKNDTLRDDYKLVGKQAVRTLKAGKPVSEKDVREEVIVRKGQDVLVVYKNKGLQITSKMEALEDGAKGERIKLLNTKSGKEVAGKVVDKNMVEVLGE